MKKNLLNKIKKAILIGSFIAIPGLFNNCEKIQEEFGEALTQEDEENFWGPTIDYKNLPDTLELYATPESYYFKAKGLPKKPITIKGDTLDFWVKFDESCVYPELNPCIKNIRNKEICNTNEMGDTIDCYTIQLADTFRCEGDWNKAPGFYRNLDKWEALNNSHNGAFCWRTRTNPETGKRQLEIGHYTHYKGHPEEIQKGAIKNHWMQWINPNEWYHFRLIDTGTEYKYWFSQDKSGIWNQEKDLKQIDPHKESELEKFMKSFYFGGDCKPQIPKMTIHFSKINPHLSNLK